MNSKSLALKRSLLMLAIFLPSISFARNIPADVASFYQKDEILKNACKASELKRLRKEVFSRAKDNKPEIAWNLIRQMLCGDDIAAYRYVMAHTKDAISTEDSTDSQDGSSVKTEIHGASLSLVRQMAWDVSVVETNGGIRVMYDDGGVCVGGFDIQPEHNSWQIVATSWSCD